LKQGRLKKRIRRAKVAPFTGAWIETACRRLMPCCIICRPLHGGVD